jgi:hypothetical protein
MQWPDILGLLKKKTKCVGLSIQACVPRLYIYIYIYRKGNNLRGNKLYIAHQLKFQLQMW